MAFPTPAILSDTSGPIHRAVRRFRWFKRSFEEQTRSISAASGVDYECSADRLAHVFVSWVRNFEAQRQSATTARRELIEFASGAMLSCLIVDKPLKAVAIPAGSDASNPAYYWPEGYVYVAYCLNVRWLVLEQEFDERIHLAPELTEARTWWSFKENVAEDPRLAVAFLDLFSGAEPNWNSPALFYENKKPQELRYDAGALRN